jgi:cytoskeleton protein RodZ
VTDSELDLQSLGAMLRQARESRAMSLQEVEQHTRIRVKFLQALESGDLSVLPSPIHAKGFLRNYAQFLHLDGNALAAQFAALTGAGSTPITTVTAARPAPSPPPRRPPAPPDTAPPAEPTVDVSDEGRDDVEPPASASGPATPPQATEPVLPPTPTYVTRDQQVGPGVPAGMAAPPATPTLSPRMTAPPVSVAQAEPVPASRRRGRIQLFQSNLFVVAVLLVGFVAIVWWVMARLSQVSVDDLVATEEGLAESGEAAIPTPFPSPTFRATSPPEDVVGAPQTMDRVLLVLSVEQQSWVRIVVDGEIAFEGLAEVGNVLQYEGGESVLVLAGNAGGLNVTYNGQPLGPLGERGEVVERLFTTQGQITPTYTPTVTPTSTGVPTPTPSRTPNPANNAQ